MPLRRPIVAICFVQFFALGLFASFSQDRGFVFAGKIGATVAGL
jgi:hypothetical protein